MTDLKLRMEDWLRRHFSDTVEAHKTIVRFTGALALVAIVLLSVATFLLVRSGFPTGPERQDCKAVSTLPSKQNDPLA